MATIIAAIAAIASAIAAAVSAYVALKSSEKRRTKQAIFMIVMQHRTNIAAKDCVQALNIIDLAFADNAKVRDAWAQLHDIFGNSRGPGAADQQREKIGALLKEMAADLGLGRQLRSPDFNRVYFPEALAREFEARSLQVDVDLAKLRNQVGQAADEPNFQSKFPPKPS